MSQPSTGGIRTLAVRLPEDLYTQLMLIANLDNLSMAEVVRDAVQDSIESRCSSGELATLAQAALEQVDREATARRNALQALIGQPDEAKPDAPAKPNARRQAGESTS